MNLNNLNKILKDYPDYRLKQAQKAVFCDFIENWNEATVLPQDLRELLNKECPLEIKSKLLQSEDKDVSKALIYFNDSNVVETVLMQYKEGRNSICVSSQIGCMLKCLFCATGEMGFKRNLLAEEIVEQFIFWQRHLKKQGQKITNVVFMGMGEPFLNYDEVLESIKIINDKDGINLGARHISISTSGVIEGIEKLANQPLQVNLAVSLNAANDELRSELMPINKMYPIEKLLKAVKNYLRKTNRKVMIEYVMLQDVNDSKIDAMELAELLKNNLEKLFVVNLISYNQTGKYFPSSQEKIKEFKNYLEKQGIEVVQRYKFGRDIWGGCGQLVGATRL